MKNFRKRKWRRKFNEYLSTLHLDRWKHLAMERNRNKVINKWIQKYPCGIFDKKYTKDLKEKNI